MEIPFYRVSLDQPAFDRKRLKAEKLIVSKVLEQLIHVQNGRGLLSWTIRARRLVLMRERRDTL
jgi:hypothetical protein